MPILVAADGPDEGARLGFLPEGEPLVFGSGAGSDFVLSDPFLAREHFELLRRPGQLLVQEIGGEARVRGKRAETETAVDPGAMIEAGSSFFVLAVRGPVFEEGPLTGKKLAGYELLERVGSGGMGEVYRARQLELDRVVAIKILADELTSDAAYVERFMREARAAGALNHPNVVHVHDVGEAEGVYYYSMEFIPGGTVLDLLRRKGLLCPVDALAVVAQAGSALEFAEKVGIVHCDIKPDNLMLTETGQIRLADLGIAKRIGESIPQDPDEGVFGSPYYMSPEQAKGYEIDNRTDIYSLGATFYRLLAGRPPFLGKDAREIMEKQAFEEARALGELKPSLPEALASIVEKMMRKERGERYGSAADLLQDINRAKENVRKRHEPMLPSRRTMVAATRRRSISSLGASVAACAFLAGVLAGMVWPDAPDESPAHVLGEIERALGDGRLAEAEDLIEAAASPDQQVDLARARGELARRKAEAPEREALRKIASSQEGGRDLVRSLRQFAGGCVSPAVAAEAERLAGEAEGEIERRAEKAFRKALARADLLASELRFRRSREVLEEFIRSAPDTLAAGRARLGLAELEPRMRRYRREAREDEAALAPAPRPAHGIQPRDEPEETVRRSFALARLYMLDEAIALLRPPGAAGGEGGQRRDPGPFRAERAELSHYAELKEKLIDAIRRGALRDTSVEFGDLKGWAVSANADGVALKLRGGEEARLEWKALPVEAFARLFLSSQASRDDFEALARFCERAGIAKEARNALLRAHRKPNVRAAPRAEARKEEIQVLSELAGTHISRGDLHSAERVARAAELRFGPGAAAGMRGEIEKAAVRKAELEAAREELERLRRELPALLHDKARASAERYAEMGELITSGDVLLAAGELASARERYRRSASPAGGLPARAAARLAVAWALDIDEPSAPEHARELACRAIEAEPEHARKEALDALRLAARREALKERLARLKRSREEEILDRARTEDLVEFLRSALPLGGLLRVELEFLRARFPDSLLVTDGTCDAFVVEHDWRLRDHGAVLEGLIRLRGRPGGALPFGREILLWQAESFFFAGDRAKAAKFYKAYAAGAEDEFVRSGTLEKRLRACEGR